VDDNIIEIVLLTAKQSCKRNYSDIHMLKTQQLLQVAKGSLSAPSAWKD